jgi:hypothetical protein
VAKSRFPSFNGIETELFDVRGGLGLSIVTIEKLNGKPNVLAALGISLDGQMAPSDQAHAARQALMSFIDGCAVLSDEHRTTLTYVLNLDSDAAHYKKRLPARRMDLERQLGVGRRKVATYEVAAIRLLAEQLLNAVRQRP